MKRISKQICKIISLSLSLSFIFLPNANADSAAPEIISVKPSPAEVYVGKKWNNVTFQVVIRDQSINVKTSKSILKSTNAQSKDINCDDVNTIEKAVSGDFFEHRLTINCVLPKNTDAPDVRFLEFTVTDSAGLSTIYKPDAFNTKVNFIAGFDPKVIERSQTDAGKLRLVEDCISYEQQRIGSWDLYKEVAKFPAGNPFEARYKEAKTAFATSFNCNLGADLLTRVSDYEDLIKRLSLNLGDFLSYSQKLAFDSQMKLILEKTAPLKKTSITCVKGKISKVVKGANPKCPAGYKKK